MTLERDTRLGNYIIRERIGGGGMGVVYRARHALYRREVAIKTIQPRQASDQEFLSRFKREAVAVGQINHPNIVFLIEFVEGDPSKGEISYLVMEYLSGKDLGKLIKETGALEITRAVDRTLEICAAVGTVHRIGYLHRDIKPNNIFITEYDGIELAKMLDFGAAKTWGERPQPKDATAEELTREGMVFGTPEYFAPEIFQGKPASPKSDQYAIGVVLYTMLTGDKPFASDPAADNPQLALWQAVAKGQYPKARDKRPQIPRGLESAVERAMNIDPARRFTDVRELGAALLEWASEPARQRYTAHFTSAPAASMPPQSSMAIDTNTRESTLPPPAGLTCPTVIDSSPAKQETRQLGTAELLVAAGETPDLPMTSPLPRPTTLIVAGAGALILAAVVVLGFHRSKPAPLPPAPPPDLLAPPPTRAPVLAPPPVAPAALPPPAQPVAPSEPSVTPSPTEKAPTAPASSKRPIHHRKKAPPPVDEKGFPFPS